MDYKYLLHIDSPADLKRVPRGDLPIVAEELRDYLVTVVSKVGGHLASSLGAVFTTVATTIGNLIFTGVFDRFPELRICCIETGVGWIPHFMEQLDDRYWRNRGWGEINIKEAPSYYWHQNFAATFIMDVIGLQIRHAVGVENMMWSTDYPHHGCDWPYSRKVIDETFVGIDPTEREKILAGNAVRLWKLDQ